ncbi:hypothetical protein AMTR_s00049p00157230 [Amborella trichopoda]|uniref:Uncharacterized protein n=1 Tax=Amborella trichopoda TaxID=13333 RepID=W1Q036_AMBTC|nr:hypothetical protein AMTR_s00049p00157230 [Amborella trichopoda]
MHRHCMSEGDTVPDASEGLVIFSCSCTTLRVEGGTSRGSGQGIEGEKSEEKKRKNELLDANIGYKFFSWGESSGEK